MLCLQKEVLVEVEGLRVGVESLGSIGPASSGRLFGKPRPVQILLAPVFQPERAKAMLVGGVLTPKCTSTALPARLISIFSLPNRGMGVWVEGLQGEEQELG